MDRRGFLTTTFAGGLAATTGACSTTLGGQTSEAPLGTDALDRKLARLDATLARMNHKQTAQWFRDRRLAAGEPAPTESDRERLTHEGELVRASLRSALLVSTVAELPEANRDDPRVSARLNEIADEADYAVLGTLAKLGSLDAAALQALDNEFASGSPGMDVAGHIDELSAKFDVPASRRLHLRRMAKHLDWRLERERFSSIVAELVDKVGRAVETAARSATEAGAPWVVAGPDPSWIERTQSVVRFYAPAPAEPAAPAAEPAAPVAEPAAPVAEPAAPPAQAASPAAAPVITDPHALPPPQAPVVYYSQAEIAAAQQREQAAQQAQATADKKRRAGAIMAGVGGGLLVLGGVALAVGLGPIGVLGAGGIAIASIGGVGLTLGIILLIVGLVMALKRDPD